MAQLFEIDSQCKTCKGSGKVLEWSESAMALQSGNPWVEAVCPSCIAVYHYAKRINEEHLREVERKRNRSGRIVELAQAVLNGPRPASGSSDLEGRCTECDRRGCICDSTPHNAWELALLVVELYKEGKI